MNTAQTTHPTLIIVRGLPGSGKSYIANALSQTLGEDNVTLVDPDATDRDGQEYKDFTSALTAEGVDAKFHPYRFIRAKAHAGIAEHKIVIWNQAFTNLDGFEKTVRNLQAHAAEQNTALPLLVVEVAVAEDVAKARVAQRAAGGGHNVPEEAFARFIGEYKSFADQGYSTVAVDGEDDVSKSVATITHALRQLGQK